MKNLFAQIYEILIDLYERALSYELAGICADQGIEKPELSLYVSIGLMSVGLSVLMALIFYFVINHPYLNRWYHWLGMGVLNGLMAFGIGYYPIYTRLLDGAFCEEYLDPNSTTYITESSIFGFGIVNFCFSLVIFILTSFMVRWWSTNAATTPIPS